MSFLSSKICFKVLRNGLEKPSIDFADFLTYAEPETVVLLLKFSNSGAVLNVTIEKIQGGNDLRAMSVGLGVSTDSIGESGGWMVRKGMHTRQLLQQRTDTDDQTETGETWTPLLNMYKAQMQFCKILFQADYIKSE
ncbi:PREDICTED: uncharacterized protein LOC106327562 isoform X1 [Brassica oleracea var. oleracea]|uniref:uncharacterized protein LOC106327562 isoform X1 n=1 Tax=Brassica oleracea var. oleracea TaxID=109376 RepID=UPI0006A6D944|nr:PREDICTED: uncharacterized protein LOC106327562 isoform X1 [Brassica oleracea var. oleracea]